MSDGGGFSVDPEILYDFGDKLRKVSDSVRDSARMLGSCVGDIGIFGVIGEVFGAGASAQCDETGDQLNTYAGKLEKYEDALNQCIKEYEARDKAALDALSRIEI